MSIYKTAIDLQLNSALGRQIAEATGLLRVFDKQAKETASVLNRMKFGSAVFENMAKLKKEFGSIQSIAVHSSQTMNSAYGALFKNMRTQGGEAAKALGRDFGSATKSMETEIGSVERRLGGLLGRMRNIGASGSGRSIRHSGNGGSALDVLAMGPQHSGIFAGANVKHALGGMLEANGELQRQLNLYRMSGASAESVSQARSAAFRSATMVPDVGVAEQAKLLRELVGATGDEKGSILALPDAAKAMSVMGALTGRSSEEDMKRLFKFIELRGVAIDEHSHKIDVEKFAGELNYATKAIGAAQGLITSNDMLQFAKQAGSMAKGMSGEDLFTTMLAAMEDMGGARSGTSLTAVGRQFLGGIMTGGKVKRLDELGLLGRSGIDRSDPDKLKITDPAKGIVGYDVLTNQGFGAFMEQVFRPALASHGITDRQKQNEELYRSVGTDTARRLMGLFLSGHEQVSMVADRFRKAMGGSEGYDKIFGSGEDLQTSTKAVRESFTTLKTALGDAAGVAPVLMSVARGVSALADAAKDHTALATGATLGGVAGGAALMGYGAIKTMTGFGLPAAATQLTTAAVALEAAAVKLGGGRALEELSKSGGAKGGFFGKAGGLVGKALGALGIWGLAEAAQDSNVLAAPKLSDGFWKNVLNVLDPGLAGRVIGDGLKKPAEDAGKSAGLSLLQGFLSIFSKLGATGDGVSPISFSGGMGGLIHRASLGGAIGRGLGAGGATSAGGSVLGIPSSVQMTDAERNTLGLILKHESHGQNVMNYMGRRRGLDPQTAKGYTAQGYFQMLNSNWRRIAPRLGITSPNAMSASLEDQTRVALDLLRHGGVGNWSRYNPALRGALSRGDRAPSSPPPTAGPPPRREEGRMIQVDLHMDRKKVGRAIASGIAEDSKFPRHVGGMDTHGSWRPPGTTLIDAA